MTLCHFLSVLGKYICMSLYKQDLALDNPQGLFKACRIYTIDAPAKNRKRQDEYLLKLKHLTEDCNYKAVSVEEHKAEVIRNTFVCGLLSRLLRQRLLENVTRDLTTVFDQARALKQAQKSSAFYSLSLKQSLVQLRLSPATRMET